MMIPIIIVERFIPDSVIVSAIIANPSLMDKHYKCACKSQLAYVYRSPALTNKPGYYYRLRLLNSNALTSTHA